MFKCPTAVILILTHTVYKNIIKKEDDLLELTVAVLMALGNKNFRLLLTLTIHINPLIVST